MSAVMHSWGQICDNRGSIGAKLSLIWAVLVPTSPNLGSTWVYLWLGHSSRKTFFRKNHTFYLELDLISLIANPKGENQALSIRIRGRHVFRVFLLGPRAQAPGNEPWAPGPGPSFTHDFGANPETDTPRFQFQFKFRPKS